MRGLGGAPEIRPYTVASALWRAEAIRIAVLSDLHICTRWSPLDALENVVDRVLAEGPDLILLPGDFITRGILRGVPATMAEIAACLSRLRAPLGVFASLGNHDWRDCPEARVNGFTATSVERILEDHGIPVLSNRAVPLPGGVAWLVGIDSQQGIGWRYAMDPRHDMDRALADVPDGASAILMAHEPDVFLDDPRAFALQVSGHTHGGQISLFGWRPATASRHGTKVCHGLKKQGERHLVVSAGLGYTGLPIRSGVPPEIVMIDLAPKPN